MFRAVSLSKHMDIGHYKYSGYGIGFDRKGADMSSSVYTNKRTKTILILGKDFMQGLDNTAIYAEKTY